MSLLPGTAELFAGAIAFVALEAAGTSDATTKPAANSNLWLEIGQVEKFQHKQSKTTENYSVPDAQTGWRDGKREYVFGESFEVTTRNISSLFLQLEMGLAGAITIGTAQTPFVNSNRMLRCWLKIQQRKQVGTDEYLLDAFCEVRLMGDAPEIAKATQKFGYEFWALYSTLNAFNQAS